MKCKIIDCDHPVKYTGKQLCGMHYQQIYHHGKIIVKSPRLCSVEGCNGIHYMKSFCISHFNKERRKGTIYPGKICSVIGCGLPIFTFKHMLCERHQKQIKKKGCVYKSKQEPNDHIIHENHISIILLRKDRTIAGEALIDKDDFEKVIRQKWSVYDSKMTMYAISRTGGRKINMHNFVKPFKEKADHANGNGLDNRKNNLRPATSTQNSQNRRIGQHNTSGFKGVRWRDRENKFISIISVSKKPIVLGYFDNPIEAAKAYDQAAIMHFGEFARTNKMEGRL